MIHGDIIEGCIRDSEERIVAWTVGMSDEDVDAFLENHPGTYLSIAWHNDQKGVTE